MKFLFSGLLIIIISFHWIGGYFCFKTNFSIEIESVMNNVEKKIAEAVKEEMGLDVHVEIIHEDQLNAEDFGYSGSFIFSKEIDGKTYHYKINSDPVKIVNQEYLTYQHQGSEGSTDKTILFKRLFSKFTVQNFSPSLVGKFQDLCGRNFIYTDSQDIFYPSIPLPPPKGC